MISHKDPALSTAATNVVRCSPEKIDLGQAVQRKEDIVQPKNTERYHFVRHVSSTNSIDCYEVVDQHSGFKVIMDVGQREFLSDDAAARQMEDLNELRQHDDPRVRHLVDVLIVGNRPAVVRAQDKRRSIQSMIECKEQMQPRFVVDIATNTLCALLQLRLDGVETASIHAADILVDSSYEVSFDNSIALQQFMSAARPEDIEKLSSFSRYDAPEIVRGDAPDERSVVYSLAAMLYELLSGRHLFDGESEAQMRESIIEGRILPLENEKYQLLAEVISSALAKEPSERPQSLEDFARRFELIHYRPRLILQVLVATIVDCAAAIGISLYLLSQLLDSAQTWERTSAFTILTVLFSMAFAPFVTGILCCASGRNTIGMLVSGLKFQPVNHNEGPHERSLKIRLALSTPPIFAVLYVLMTWAALDHPLQELAAPSAGGAILIYLAYGVVNIFLLAKSSGPSQTLADKFAKTQFRTDSVDRFLKQVNIRQSFRKHLNTSRRKFGKYRTKLAVKDTLDRRILLGVESATGRNVLLYVQPFDQMIDEENRDSVSFSLIESFRKGEQVIEVYRDPQGLLVEGCNGLDRFDREVVLRFLGDMMNLVLSDRMQEADKMWVTESGKLFPTPFFEKQQLESHEIAKACSEVANKFNLTWRVPAMNEDSISIFCQKLLNGSYRTKEDLIRSFRVTIMGVREFEQRFPAFRQESAKGA